MLLPRVFNAGASKWLINRRSPVSLSRNPVIRISLAIGRIRTRTRIDKDSWGAKDGSLIYDLFLCHSLFIKKLAR